MLLELKRGVNLLIRLASMVMDSFTASLFIVCKLTSVNGLRGGPDAISADFVPGRILLSAPCSSFVKSSVSVVDASCVAFMPGELGVIWTSVKGGGLGRRGELEGDAGLMLTAASISSQPART